MLFHTTDIDDTARAVLGEIDDLRERLRLRLHEPQRWHGSLRRLSFARAIQGSNSIEGYNAELDDVAAVALGEPPLDAGSETALALAGYRDAMTFVLQLASDPEFSYSPQLLKSLHFMMTSYHLPNRPGQWRSGTVFVRDDEADRVVYEGPDVDEVPDLMVELAEELNQQSQLPHLISAGMAHLNLVMIHPFRDGNGRMARGLQSLVLARSGLLSPIFMSIEEYLGRNTTEYYRVLADVGKGSWQPSGATRLWTRFLLTAHLRQARTVLRRAKESEQLWMELDRMVSNRGLPNRSLAVLFDAASGLRVRNGTYQAALRGSDEIVSFQTASRDLQALVKAELLIPKGQARGRWYVASPKLRELRQQLANSRNGREDSDPFGG
ncbi:MAG: Fic family protein [Mycobacteriales bacterium]